MDIATTKGKNMQRLELPYYKSKSRKYIPA
jgi:hypothetical protein